MSNKAPSNLNSLFEMEDTEVMETKKVEEAKKTPVLNAPDFRIYSCNFCGKLDIEGRFTLAQHICECIGDDAIGPPRNAYKEKVYQRESRRRLMAIRAMIRKVRIEASENSSNELEDCPFGMGWTCNGCYTGVEHIAVLHVLAHHTKEEMRREMSKEEITRFAQMYRMALPRLEYFFRLVK